MNPNEKADQIEERLIDFGVRIIQVAGEMPANYASAHIAKQMLRSGTAPAPHYGEARGAESREDFIHKLRIALKELNETQIWLKMAARAKFCASRSFDLTIDECRQLSRILNASIHTTRRNMRNLGRQCVTK